jgi:hypothetical protein
MGNHLGKWFIGPELRVQEKGELFCRDHTHVPHKLSRGGLGRAKRAYNQTPCD